MIEYVGAAIAALIATALVWKLLKELASRASSIIVNAVAGTLILLAVNSYLGWTIPVNKATVLICALFGFQGVGSILVLEYFGLLL